jgi:hypothetical protein
MPAISTGLERLGYGGSDGCIATGIHRNVILSSEGATRTLLAKESGSLVLCDVAAATTFTLPTPVAGMSFDFALSITITGTLTITSGSTAIFLTGGVALSSLTVGESGTAFAANGSSHYRMVIDNNTKGRIKGNGLVRFVGLTPTLWHVSGWLTGAGTLADPFA